VAGSRRRRLGKAEPQLLAETSTVEQKCWSHQSTSTNLPSIFKKKCYEFFYPILCESTYGGEVRIFGFFIPTKKQTRTKKKLIQPLVNNKSKYF